MLFWRLGFQPIEISEAVIYVKRGFPKNIISCINSAVQVLNFAIISIISHKVTKNQEVYYFWM